MRRPGCCWNRKPTLGGLGFNDITTDAAGRVYAGSLAFRPVAEGDEPKPGHLYVIDLDGNGEAAGRTAFC